MICVRNLSHREVSVKVGVMEFGLYITIMVVLIIFLLILQTVVNLRMLF